jgi:DHA1 family multidrug resistance protein B-like MFS transporter
MVELLVNQFINFLFVPFMVVYFSRHYGTAGAGVLVTVALSASFVAAIPAGYLADIYGRRIVIVCCEVLRAIGLALMGAASIANASIAPALMFVGFLVVMASGGAAYPALQALVIDTSAPEQRHAIYTLEYMLYNLVIVCGSMLGTVLFDWRLGLIFTAGSVASIALTIVFARTLPTDRDDTRALRYSAHGALAHISAHYRPVLSDRLFMLFLVASILALMTERLAFNYLSATLPELPPREIGLPLVGGTIAVGGLQLYGWILAENALVVILCGVLTNWVTQRLGKPFPTMLVALLGTGIGFAMMAMTQDAGALIALVFVATCGELIYWPLRQSYMAGLTNTTNRAAYMVANVLAFRAAMALGSVSILVGAITSASVVAAVIILVTLASIGLFAFSNHRLEKTVAPPPEKAST